MFKYLDFPSNLYFYKSEDFSIYIFQAIESVGASGEHFIPRIVELSDGSTYMQAISGTVKFIGENIKSVDKRDFFLFDNCLRVQIFIKEDEELQQAVKMYFNTDSV